MDGLLYLQRKDIDEAKWNNCIKKSSPGLLYGCTYYLDAMAHDWDAIVLNDYEGVMPLPYKKKYGIRYVYMPPFVQQLGFFSAQYNNDDALAALQKAKQYFRFGNYQLHHGSVLIDAATRNNYVLNLQEGYAAVYKNYKQDLLKNLARSRRLGLHYNSTHDYLKVIRLFQSLYVARQLHIAKEDYKRFALLCKHLLTTNEIIIREVTDAQRHLLAAAICFKDKRRLYFIMSATTPEGRRAEANHFLVDNLIQEHAGQNILLDFEGSDVAGIAHFYKNFGSVNQPYSFVSWNHLPWPIRFFKQ